jgi:hypothetical protein
VRQLIIDDGLLTRLHRSDIFSPVAKQAGVGCGPHATQGTMCAIDLASASFGAATTPTMSLSAYHSRLDALHGQYGVAGCNKIEDSVSLDDSNNPLDAKIVWFCKDFDLPLYEVKVNGAGDVTGNGQTTAFRAYMTMKAAVDGGYIYGAFSYGNNADGRYVEHAVVEDKEGHKRGVFDFNADGTVKTGETFNVEGQRVGVISGP